MNIVARKLVDLSGPDETVWEQFSVRSEGGEVYCLPSWARAAVLAYGLEAYVLIATGEHKSIRVPCLDGAGEAVGVEPSAQNRSDEVLGILPIVRVCHWLFGGGLVSLPFCDGGGGLVGDRWTGMALFEKACEFADGMGVPTIEVRQLKPLGGVGGAKGAIGAREDLDSKELEKRGWKLDGEVAEGKVRMVLPLADSPEALLRSFKSKLRSQIQKPTKEGLTVRKGGQELLDDFYRVFVENMRDIGSPVHSRRFVEQVVLQYGSAARIFVVHKNGVALAASLTLGFKGVLSNPWASSLRRYSHLAPNMLLYWSMIEYACQNGYRTFDFGRSTVGEGTYRFKEQWGARPEPLYWYRFTRADVKSRGLDRDSGRMNRAVEIWKRLPLPVTRVLGPRIRRYISL